MTSQMSEIVLLAIKNLTKNTGWSTRTIIKYIKREYNVDDKNISGRITRALHRGVKLGLLKKKDGLYRLKTMSKIARQSLVSREHTKRGSSNFRASGRNVFKAKNRTRQPLRKSIRKTNAPLQICTCTSSKSMDELIDEIMSL